MERVIVWHRWSPPSEPSREAASWAAQWRSASRERFNQVAAEVLCELGGSVVFALEPSALTRALELCLIGAREGEREEGMGGIGYGVALGPLDGSDALDRAQALAHVGGAHGITLDGAAQALASASFLFAREVATETGLVGAVLDRSYPRRSDCQRAVAKLARPPFPAHGQSQFEALRKLAKGTGRQRVLLAGPHGIGLGQWVHKLLGELAPPLWLDVRALGMALTPMSGLAYALRRLPVSASPEHVLTRADEADQQARGTLVALRAGSAVPRRDAILAVRQFLARSGEAGRRPVAYVDPPSLIDPSSIGVIAEATREGGPDALTLVRMLPDSRPPEAFARGGSLAEVRMRGMSPSESRAYAAAMLGGAGGEPPSDIARRAVAMGGPNPLAVATALRMLVASGDVVFDASGSDGSEGEAQGHFRWRRRPAGRVEPLSFEALLEDRLDVLPAPLRRVLEVLVTVPDPDDRELTGAVAEGEGLLEETWIRAVEELDAHGLVSFDTRGIAVEPVLRHAVAASIAPARALALHAGIARALSARNELAPDDFARATLAYHLAHAGKMTEAAAQFLAVAARCGQLGFLRSGVRLAAAAVECDSSEAVRARASRIAESLSERQTGTLRMPKHPGSAQPSLDDERGGRGSAPALPNDFASEAGTRAVQAILTRDFDEVERALELLIAAGRQSVAIERLRTVALLVRGDPQAASALLHKLDLAAEGAPSAQLLLTRALVAMANGQLASALRAALETLARTREARDPLGERAALSALAICLRRLGREADATQLARVALAPSTAGGQRAHA